MKEVILLNERYGVIEIDEAGIIIGYNKQGSDILSELFRLNPDDDLKDKNLTELTCTGENKSYDPAAPEKIISTIKGIRLIDSIYYKETESIVLRFIMDREHFTSLFYLIKNSSSLFLELDKDLNVLFTSDSFCKNSGKDKSLIFGESISVLTDKDSADNIRSAADLCINSVVECMKIENIHFVFNGITRIYDMELSPAIDNSGLLCGIYCYLVDTFYQKKCQKMISSVRRMSAVANFAGGIAHDYNNALTAVLGNLSLAKMDVENNSELEELLRDAESAGLKIKILTERLGTFARGMKPSKKNTDIKELIENTLVEVFSGYRGNYKVNIQDNMMHPEIDQELISEALRHVIENAIDAADNTDGKILIEAKETEVENEIVFRETSLVSGKYILISVQDNGEGLDQQIFRDIFDPYVTTKAGREGLGLALAYTILKRHRGFISSDITEKGDTIFNIYIPLF